MGNGRTRGGNFTRTRLSEPMASTDTTARVVSSAGFESPCYVVIDPENSAKREVILFDGVFTDTALVTSSANNRHLSGSAAASGLTHDTNAVVWSAPVGQILTDIWDELERAPIVVAHGSTAATSRPSFAVDRPVTWRGTVEPTNATNGDEWVDTATGDVRVKVSGSFVLASKDANDDLYVARALVEAAGDLLVGSADETLARLALGSALQHLRVNVAGDGLEYADPPTVIDDHGDLDGLDDDDHPQYLAKAGGTMSGALTMADEEIIRAQLRDTSMTVSTVASSGSSQDIDCETANVWDVTLDDDCTFTFTNPPAAAYGELVVILRQDGNGSHTPTWPGTVAWPGGTEPMWSTTANAVDVAKFITVDGGTSWLGVSVGLAFAVPSP